MSRHVSGDTTSDGRPSNAPSTRALLVTWARLSSICLGQLEDSGARGSIFTVLLIHSRATATRSADRRASAHSERSGRPVVIVLAWHLCAKTGSQERMSKMNMT